MFSFFYNLLRVLYFPFLRWVLPLLNSKAKARLSFEKKNLLDESCNSFKLINKSADYAFEVSSEGELQQVIPIILKVLRQKHLVEIIYCSDSVEKQCLNLFKKYPESLRLLRLPILTFNPFNKFNPYNWLTAKSFYLCRYDFFPELIFYGRKSNVDFNLIAGTLKNSDSKKQNFIIKSFIEYVYKSFNHIVMATQQDKLNLIDRLGINGDIVESYDFRPVQIYNRIDKKDEQLKNNFNFFDLYLEYMNEFPKHRRIMLGSYWYDENLILGQNIDSLVQSSYQLSIVPHQLSKSDLVKTKESILENNPSANIYVLDNEISEQEAKSLFCSLREKPGVLIINLKGVLCELYTLYGHAYVAGGYRYSVHSLLEPFAADSMVYCGPKVHRSTEYDLIMQSNPDRVLIVEQASHLFGKIIELDLKGLSSTQGFKSHYKGHFSPIMNWLNIKGSWE